MDREGPPPPRRLTREFIADRLSSLLDGPQESKEIRSDTGRLHQTAAVLSDFTIGELPELLVAAGTDTPADLLDSSTIIYSGTRPRAMLRADVRRRALASLGSQENIRQTLLSVKDSSLD